MIIRIQHQEIRGSPGMDQYIEGKLSRLERYLSPEAMIEIAFGSNSTHLFIRNLKHEYSFNDEGLDLYDAFSKVLETAAKILRIEHQRIINKIHRNGPSNQIIEP